MTDLVIRDEQHYLARIAEIGQLVAKIETVGDARDLADRARAAQVWAQRAKLGHEQVNLAATAKLWAERRAGELLAEDPDISPGKGRGVRPLEQLGVSKHESSRWQKLAAIPADEFKHVTEQMAEEGVVSAAAVLKKSGRRERNRAARQERVEAEEQARDAIASTPEIACRIEQADLRSWRPKGVSAILTDPPYITDDAVELHSALADFALDVLPDGGALAVMTWQPLLPAVLEAMRRPELVYRWTAAWVYETSERTPERGPRVFDGWKPILVFHKGHVPNDVTYLYDVIRSGNADKESHEWGQSVGGFRQLVRAFTAPGDVVCDPFLGGGTTAIAALSEARRFVGCDIDNEAVLTTLMRLSP